MQLPIVDPSLVLILGVSGAGKSTLAGRLFEAGEVLSSDHFREMVSGSEADQQASREAFEVLTLVLERRLARGLLTVVDATNLKAEDRRQLLDRARRHYVPATAIVLDMPPALCLERNLARERQVPAQVIQKQSRLLRESLFGLEAEGFRHIFYLHTPAQAQDAVLERRPLPCLRRDEHGPFDIIGDVHGCYGELLSLLARLGYAVEGPEGKEPRLRPPAGRRLLFVGDLIDRGPDSASVLALVMAACQDGIALCVPGNHDYKLLRVMQGQPITPRYGLAESLAQIEARGPVFVAQVRAFIEGLPCHYVLDSGRLVLVHAGIKEVMQGRDGGPVRSFCIFGQTLPEPDAQGLPIRYNWAADYRGQALVAYGHTPVPAVTWVHNTVNLDTGCVYGGLLSALRYPERETVSVPGMSAYAKPLKPILPLGG